MRNYLLFFLLTVHDQSQPDQTINDHAIYNSFQEAADDFAINYAPYGWNYVGIKPLYFTLDKDTFGNILGFIAGAMDYIQTSFLNWDVFEQDQVAGGGIVYESPRDTWSHGH
jgi:hypothetical protein